jgi:transposase
MVTFRELLAAKPGVFQSMTGVSPKEFHSLLAQVEPRYQAMVKSRIERADRKRAPGAGEKSRYDVADRLLMTLVWLRLYLTCEAVGFLFGVDKSTVSRFTRPILLILRDIGADTLGWPQEAKDTLESTEPPAQGSGEGGQNPPGVPEPPDSPTEPAGEEDTTKKSEAEAIVTPDQSGCSDYLAIVDATEQRVERPKVYEKQKQHYSGKKKAHTIKTQIIVNEHGRIRDVRASVPGSTHDLTLLRESGVKDDLPKGLTVMGDTGYRGLQNDFPDRSVGLPYRPKDKQKLTPEERLHNHFISSIRIVVENTLCEMKHFQALVARFRHSLERHSEITKAIAGITNLRIDNRLVRLSIACSTTT